MSGQIANPMMSCVAMALAVALSGCSSSVPSVSLSDLNPLKENPFSNPDYSAFNKRNPVSSRSVTAQDLIGGDGRCAFDPAPAPEAIPAPSAAPQAEPAPINPASNRALYFTAGPQAGGPAPAAAPPEVRTGPRGIALAMTECDVVRVAGQSDRVEIGANERGQRTVTLTYLRGERPGIYRFGDGRLASMERVAEPPAPPKPKRPAKTAKPRA